MACAQWSRFFVIAVVLGFLCFDTDVSLAIDPKFEIDLKKLRPVEKQTPKSRQESKAGKQLPANAGAKATAPGRGKVSEGAAGSIKRTANSPTTVSSARVTVKSRSGQAVKRARTLSRKRRRTLLSHRRKPAASPVNGSQALSLTLRMPGAAGVDRGERLLHARNVWNRIVPPEAEGSGSLSLQENNYSLSLDPVAYPLFRGFDGGRIIVDADGTLSPLVKAIIEERDSTAHVVNADPADSRRFYSSLLASARFYSVEEDFTFSFGSDPRVTINSDFKIEKTSDSLLNHDVLLLNVSDHLMGMPASLQSMLNREGFKIIDAAPGIPGLPADRKNRLYSVKGGDQRAMVDSLLAASSVRFEKDRDIKLDDGPSSGVILVVRADRYYVVGGQKVVVTFSKADPVQHALLKLLQQNGYQVLTILPDYDLRRIAEKMLPVMKQPGRYGTHDLWRPRNAPFAMQMSGVAIADSGRKGGIAFVTDVGIDSLTGDLLAFMGYDVLGR